MSLNLAEIKGHDKAKKVLKSVLKSGRIPHAFLFEGTHGIGKYSTAKSFAKSLNCESLKDYSSCNSCIACRKIDKDIHPDVQTVRPETQQKGQKNHIEGIKVHQIRELISKSEFSAFEGNKKIFIIENAETMNRQAANCFLKTLEEPSSATHFILITDNINAMLPTIISRCHTIHFFPLQPDEVFSILNGQLHDKKNEETKIKLAANISCGSPGAALELFESDFETEREAALDLISGKITDSYAAVFSFSEKFSADSAAFEKLIFWILTLIRDILILRINNNINNIVNIDLKNELFELSQRIEQDKLMTLFHFIGEIKNKMVYNLNKQILLEEITLKIKAMHTAT